MTHGEILKELASRDRTMFRYERKNYDRYLARSGLAPAFPYVHVAGSNGKGSVSSYIAAGLSELGKRTGLYLSPWLEDPCEGILLDGEPISRSDFDRIFEEELDLYQEFDLSSFEIATSVMFRYFNEKKVDFAVIECGMGGTIDATNIPSGRPSLCVLTSVALEHTRFLGKTIEEIADAKLGILREGVPLVAGPLPQGAMKRALRKAELLGSKVIPAISASNIAISSSGCKFDIGEEAGFSVVRPSFGQVRDFTIAWAAIKELGGSVLVDREAMKKRLRSVALPGRFEEKGRLIIDGAHNPEAVSLLVRSIEAAFPREKFSVLFLSFRDKEIEKEKEILKDLAKRFACASFDHPRSCRPSDYERLSPERVFPTPEEGISYLLAFPERILVVGSLYTAMRLSKEDVPHE